MAILTLTLTLTTDPNPNPNNPNNPNNPSNPNPNPNQVVVPTDAQPGDIMTLTTQTGQRMKAAPWVERGPQPAVGPAGPVPQEPLAPSGALAGWGCGEGHLCDRAFHAAGGGARGCRAGRHSHARHDRVSAAAPLTPIHAPCCSPVHPYVPMSLAAPPHCRQLIHS